MVDAHSEHPHTDLMYEIAKRVRELADQKMPDLRYMASTPKSGDGLTQNAVDQELSGYSRGELIEMIIHKEFEPVADNLDMNVTYAK